ncbi:MAG: hypothetical protein SOX56_07320 [[Pasteurella] mairii]|uniref:Uncharacterized protein n=1 Tax=[Pasteurella] mairii TaxID=757 RepID=A0A379B3T9_9PAST|nr:hypothetical protein [[Pasteurella] mairii]SUB33305.1 Uncharacterised protein [[Pasteurella] mairii]
MYGQLQQISSDLIKQFGSPCAVQMKTAGEYNPLTGEFVADAELNKAYCLFDNLAYDFNRSGLATSAAVKQGDVMLYLTAESRAEINATVFVNGENWVIIHCQPIKPANTVMIYQCQARRTR